MSCRTRYTLAAIFASLVAVLCIAIATWRPKVTYLIPRVGNNPPTESSAYDWFAENNSPPVSIEVTIRNDSFFPVWCAQAGESSCEMHVFLPQSEVVESVAVYPDKPRKWIRIAGGESVSVDAPFFPGDRRMRIGVVFYSWSGAYEQAWSEELNPTEIFSEPGPRRTIQQETPSDL